jgi:hypothetical protein
MFFFEKKNQKTFICFGPIGASRGHSERWEIDKSFLLLFFKKEVLSYCLGRRSSIRFRAARAQFRADWKGARPGPLYPCGLDCKKTPGRHWPRAVHVRERREACRHDFAACE